MGNGWLRRRLKRDQDNFGPQFATFQLSTTTIFSNNQMWRRGCELSVGKIPCHAGLMFNAAVSFCNPVVGEGKDRSTSCLPVYSWPPQEHTAQQSEPERPSLKEVEGEEQLHTCYSMITSPHICLSVCLFLSLSRTQTYTHTKLYVFVLCLAWVCVYVCKYVCACVYMYVYVCTCVCYLFTSLLYTAQKSCS